MAKALDCIYIRDLNFRCIVGINDDERHEKQDVVTNITLWADLARACESDNIDDTLDYKALSKRIISFVEQSDFFLVEKLAEQICSIILVEFDTLWVKLTLNKKGAIRGASDVGIIIERGEK